jgi:hypothetical protein
MDNISNSTGYAKEVANGLSSFASPFRSIKTSELNVQYSADPSYGLTKKQYGWYSNDVLFDETHFTEGNGIIEIETGSSGTDTARLRSAYPGQYISQTIAEPGLGFVIPSQYLERDENNRTSLTHGEISAEIVEWDETTDSGVTALGLSFESDGVYVQIRRGDQNVVFVRQENWNLDPMDGSGPSGRVLKPENGYVYNFPFTWYNQGALYVAIYDAEIGKFIPVHRAHVKGAPSIGTPNLPVQVTVENQGTTEPLGVNVGGMQYSTYGAAETESQSRTTEESRNTAGSYISDTVVTNNNAVAPFDEPGVPLISIRRDINNLASRVSLSVSVNNVFMNVDQDCWIFIFDEYNEESALTGYNFTPPESINGTEESRVETDTSATGYVPSADATLRGMSYVSTGQKEVQFTTGDDTARLPLEATIVCTAVLATGSNATDASPVLVRIDEGF